MRSNYFTTIIITIIIMIMTAVFIVFGMIFFEMFNVLSGSELTKDFQTNIEVSSEENTIENNIKAPKIIINTTETTKKEETNTTNVNYDTVKVNKYFYNQLEEQSKTIYNAFEANRENMKSGRYKIELGTTFSNLLKQENGSDLLEKYYQSALEAYNYDNPDVFYLTPNKMYLNIETTTKGQNVSYNVYIDCGDLPNYFSDDFSNEEEVRRAINLVEEKKNEILQNKTGNIHQDIKKIHDYLVNTIEYDRTISKDNIYNIYGALINKECVCEGYARSFKYLLDDLGIPCLMVIGTATNSEGKTESHAWNYVQVNNVWYAMDVTWDDPVTTNPEWVSQNIHYKYYLKGSNTFMQDHISKGQFTEGGKVFNYPELSQKD